VAAAWVIHWCGHNVDARWNVPARFAAQARRAVTTNKIESIRVRRGVERATRPPNSTVWYPTDAACWRLLLPWECVGDGGNLQRGDVFAWLDVGSQSRPEPFSQSQEVSGWEDVDVARSPRITVALSPFTVSQAISSLMLLGGKVVLPSNHIGAIVSRATGSKSFTNHTPVCRPRR
jgi:hypothetical protein